MSFVTRVTIYIQLIKLIPVEIRVRINPQCQLFVINKAVLRIKLKKKLVLQQVWPEIYPSLLKGSKHASSN